MLGATPGELGDELSKELPIPALPPEVLVGLPSELLRWRPDIRRAERQLAAATAQIGAATADLFPKFFLIGAGGLQSISASDWFSGPSRFWTIGPTVRWPIFDAGRIRATIAVRNAQQEQALTIYERTILSAFEDVEVDAHAEYSYDAIYRLIEAGGREHIGQVSQPQTSWNDEFRVNLPHPNDGQAMRRYAEQYEYDEVGNILRFIHQAANGNWTRAYAYNEPSLLQPQQTNNRLTSATVSGVTENYLHDARGNMTRHAAPPRYQVGLSGSDETS